VNLTFDLPNGQKIIVRTGSVLPNHEADDGYTVAILHPSGRITGTWIKTRPQAIRAAQNLCKEHGVEYTGPKR
jgi:hypothetical protein